MKKAILVFWLVVSIKSLFSEDTGDADADSDYGTIGLIIISAFLIAGILALAWRKKKD